MPDYNAAREGHRNHKWIVHKAFKNVNKVHAQGKDMHFNREGRFSTSDESFTNEIRNAYPKEVTVSRVTASHASDRGHKYFFSCPAMPWHEESRQEAGSGEEDANR